MTDGEFIMWENVMLVWDASFMKIEIVCPAICMNKIGVFSSIFF